MAQLQIHPLNFGTITRPAKNFCDAFEPDLISDFPLIGWYIEGSDKKILIDTGGGDPELADPQWKPYKREQDQTVEAALNKIGINCSEIDLVIVTHLHWDHANGNLLFPNATFLVQQDELKHARSLPPNTPGACPPDIINIRYSTLSGDTEIAEGITTILTPGHTDGLQGVIIQGNEKQYFIASDSIPLFKNFDGSNFMLSNIAVDVEKFQISLNKIANLNAVILPSHDIKVFNNPVYR